MGFFNGGLASFVEEGEDGANDLGGFNLLLILSIYIKMLINKMCVM